MSTAKKLVQVPWSAIDTVLLDMDGTLLDLRFDNYFWLEVIPERYAQARAISVSAAREQLTPIFAATQGTLNWYCTDYWSRELELDIARIKSEVREHVSFLEGARAFLEQLQRWGKRRVLVTNAHPDTLRIKNDHVGLERYVDVMISSHTLGAPKEDARFWTRLATTLEFDPARTLFVDDSLNVLRAARAFGIAHIVSVARPDSTLPPRYFDEFASVLQVSDLLSTQ